MSASTFVRPNVKYSSAVKVFFQDKALQMANSLQSEKKKLQNAIDKTTGVGVISAASSVILISAAAFPCTRRQALSLQLRAW